MMVRVPVAPVVTLPADGPKLEPVTLRHAAPRVAEMFAALKSPPVAEHTVVPKGEVHVVKLRRRR